MQKMPYTQGYEYAGRVQFMRQQKSGVPVLQLDSLYGEAAPQQDITHHTVLVTRTGHAYMKR